MSRDYYPGDSLQKIWHDDSDRNNAHRMLRRLISSFNHNNDHRRGSYGLYYELKSCQNFIEEKLTNYLYETYTCLGIIAERLLEENIIKKDSLLIPKNEIWNILLQLDRVAADRIYRDKNHWDNYKELWSDPLWYAGVNLRRIYEGNPKGSYHHPDKYMKHYNSVFTTGYFKIDHERGTNDT